VLKNLGAYIELTKPRILLMVLVTTTMGFVLGGKTLQPWPLLLVTLVGVGCATGGSAVLNNYLEREVDGKMSRTRHRALPAGLIAPSNALTFGLALVLAGLAFLVCWVNLLTAFLVLLAAFLYALVYTPMKRLTWLNTSIGAIPGALPPMCGWAAATNHLDTGAWVLFAILFAWQHPHFFAIAWMFKQDYASAGFKMLPVIDPSGRRTFRQIAIFCALLIAASVAPTLIGITGRAYLWGAILLGFFLFTVAVLLSRSRSFDAARRLLKASVFYLPLLSALMMWDKL
jgi:protoheme IX farnesyltransferase